MPEPHLVFEHMSLHELQNFLADIDLYETMSAENRQHLRFWRALRIVCQDCIAQQSRSERERAVHRSVQQQIEGLVRSFFLMDF